MQAGFPDIPDPRLVRSLDSAIRALLKVRNPSGRWMDFPSLGNGSDEWVTGYIAACLAGSTAPEVRPALAKAWEALGERQRFSGGWGFMPGYPADADSTACALRVSEALPGGGGWRAWRGRAFLARHQTRSGGIATYIWPKRMVWATGMRHRFDGWCSPHVCVTSNAALLARFRGRRRLLDYLLARQGSDGSWRAYWWHDEREYATALAVAALSASKEAPHREAVRRAVDWALATAPEGGAVITSAAPEGSAFATALRMQVLAAGGPETELPCRSALGWLLEHQLGDGTWPSSAWLRFPPTQIADTTQIPTWHIGRMVEAGVLPDGLRLFTTATVVAALLAFSRREADG